MMRCFSIFAPLIFAAFLSPALEGAVTITAWKTVQTDPVLNSACTDVNTLYQNAVTGAMTHCEGGKYVNVSVPLDTTSVDVTPPHPTTDKLVLTMSADSYQGDPHVSVKVDGVVVAASQAITVARSGAYNVAAAGPGQDLVFPLSIGAAGPHTVAITFLDDLYAGTATSDRNAYLNALSYDDVNYPKAIAVLGSTGDTFSINVGIAAPPEPLPIPVPPPVATTGIPKAPIPAIPSNATHVAASDSAGAKTAVAASNAFVVLDGGTYTNSASWPVGAGTTVMGANGALLRGSGYSALTLNNGSKIYQLNLEGAGIWINNGASVIIAANSFKNIVNGSDAIHEDQYLGAESWIDSNYIYNISQPTYPNNHALWESPGSGFFSNGFGDNCKLTNNIVDGAQYDGLKGFHNQPVRNKNFLVAGNVLHHIHRIGLEFQDCSSNTNNCWSGQGGSTDHAVYKDNFFDLPWMGDRGMFAFSLPVDHSTNMQILNNSAIAAEPCCYAGGGWYGYGIEISGDGTLIQGNVVLASTKSANNQSAGWGCPLCFDNSNQSTAQMNFLCGANSKISQGGTQANGVVFPTNNIDQWNVKAPGGCPVTDDKLSTSNLAVAATASGGTINAAVVSLLSINRVDFFADSAATPFATQEIQDHNTNFGNDRKWLYHAAAPAGAKTVNVIATDVLGAQQSSQVTLGAARKPTRSEKGADGKAKASGE